GPDQWLGADHIRLSYHSDRGETSGRPQAARRRQERNREAAEGAEGQRVSGQGVHRSPGNGPETGFGQSRSAARSAGGPEQSHQPRRFFAWHWDDRRGRDGAKLQANG